MPSRLRVTAIISLVFSALVLSGCSAALHPATTLNDDGDLLQALGDQDERVTQSLAVPTTLVPKVVAPVVAPPAPDEPAVNCAKAKCVALTFDDGPGKYTDRLLDVLAKAKVPATFYLLGQNVGNYPQTVARMVKEGHQLGNHTYDHPSITRLTKAQLKKQIGATNAAVKKASGVVPTTFRPPYGAHNSVTDKLVATPLLLWDVDTLDWQHHDPAKTIKIAMQEVHSGSVILMHDIHETSVQAVPKLVTQLHKDGYTLVTVDDLFAGQSFKKSTAYTRRSTR